MREEIRLLKEWLAAPEIHIEPDELVDEILAESPYALAKDNNNTEIMPCSDTADDLVRVFDKITRPHKREFIERLHAHLENFLHSNGAPRWVDWRDVPEFFGMERVPSRRRGYQAWVLSNQRGSSQYFGEWMERKGRRQKDDRFRTTQYRIRPQALEALGRIFGGEHASGRQRH